MEGGMIDLSKYRFQSANEDLETAYLLMESGKFKASVKSHTNSRKIGSHLSCWAVLPVYFSCYNLSEN